MKLLPMNLNKAWPQPTAPLRKPYWPAKEIALAVNETMDALPEELRQAITLREIEGLSYDDIARHWIARLAQCVPAFSGHVRPFLPASNPC